ncbi:hypothetical protein L202_02204 [Cryptococcus amylolentus CBS 6039]|uniref:Uncharacterized protein n=1 Tax=Cryptococcus amylolentus CBS 6039 TaxID=1295533 RepID=A0A1E3HZP0_9TREE|nr:hypothetical protein L202_02204 [Cryptococcus amylolentus CBS 6039]ODN81843.1 hypothetical protein L202_02204 [Cryptococcus amylolentus CBS 6039]
MPALPQYLVPFDPVRPGACPGVTGSQGELAGLMLPPARSCEFYSTGILGASRYDPSLNPPSLPSLLDPPACNSVYARPGGALRCAPTSVASQIAWENSSILMVPEKESSLNAFENSVLYPSNACISVHRLYYETTRALVYGHGRGASFSAGMKKIGCVVDKERFYKGRTKIPQLPVPMHRPPFVPIGQRRFPWSRYNAPLDVQNCSFFLYTSFAYRIPLSRSFQLSHPNQHTPKPKPITQ